MALGDTISGNSDGNGHHSISNDLTVQALAIKTIECNKSNKSTNEPV